MQAFLLKIKRGDGPFFSFLKRLIRGFLTFRIPVPGFLKPVLRVFYELHFILWYGLRKVYVVLYAEPLFRSRCESIGPGFHMWILPHVTGHARIRIGAGVDFNGKVGVWSGRIFDDVNLVIGDHVTLGHLVYISVNKEVVIEDGAMVASRTVIADNDGHPRDPELRARHSPPLPHEIKPVRIGRNAWVGEDSHIRKGVTVGEGAIVGANSVVVSNVPDYCIVMGNPAKVVGFAQAASNKTS